MNPFLDLDDDGSESFGWFVEKSLQLHKAPTLFSFSVKLSPHCPVDVDVGKWAENAVNRSVRVMYFNLLWEAEPTRFPKCLYTCDTLRSLTLSEKILVDVSSPICLPSLLHLSLDYVVYKDKDSLVKLLSSCPVLDDLMMRRWEDDNLTNFTVKVSSLKILSYMGLCRQNKEDDPNGSLVIDSPALTNLRLNDVWENCLIENMSGLDAVYTNNVPYHDDKFLRSLSSAKRLRLFFTISMVAGCNAIKFSRLIEFHFVPDVSVDWLNPLMIMLQNSPKLKTLTIETYYQNLEAGLPLSWNQPSSIPECLSSHLEIFGWKDYGGSEDEKQLLAYILANSKCLKTVKISPRATCNLEETQKELGSQLHLNF